MTQQPQPFYLLVGRAAHLPLAQKIKNNFAVTIYGEGDDDFTPLINHSLIDTLRYLYQSGMADGMGDAKRPARPIVALVNGGIIMRALGNMVGNNGKDKFSASPILYLTSDNKTLVPLLGEHHGGQGLGMLLAKKLSLNYAGDEAQHEDDVPHHYFMAGKEFLPAWLAANKKINTDWHMPSHGQPQIIPPRLAVGIGLERGAPVAAVADLLTTALQKINAHPRAVATIASIDIKMDEVALHNLSSNLHLPLRFFTSEELSAVPVPNPSAVVEKETGTPSVAEAAALRAAGYYPSPETHSAKPQPKLLLEKQKGDGVTIAISEILPDHDFTSCGLTLGHLAVVGIGPGDKHLRAPLASHYILAADDIVGYQLYLDLVDDLTAGKNLHQRDLGREEERAALALDLALTGKKVVLLASGDAGIYALATLVWQLLETRKKQVADKALPHKKLSSLPITVVPGVSAFQALAAKLGAPAGNDFAVISLSDLMTPRAKILQRLRGALQGDFPIFLYNPKSKTRVDLLAEVITLAREFLPPDTAVVIGKNLYRPSEDIIVRDLKNFSIDDVDMFSCVMISNSTMRQFNHLGRAILYAPRGY
ncbi:MAG: cobalamin biosynthesis protein [Hydrotalea sp.]|nr:cobalamin biosynthesis protein [Hydrotalea sp.]